MKINKKIYHIILSLAAFTVTIVAEANPVLDNIANGSVTVNQTSTTTEINQSSQQAILNWHEFNIKNGEVTRFNQPNGGITLNRIDPKQGASQIYGQLTATGKIILVNQAGIYFGPGSFVDVGGIIASTSDISNQNFLNGKYIFDQPSAYSGSIVNQGTIIARNAGLAALVGTSVSNEGLIQANLGQIVLASGKKFTVDISGDGLVNFAIDEGIDKAGTHPVDGSELKTGVNNKGALIANGGKIILSVKSASGVLDHAINMEGVAQAHSVRQHNGEIILSGGNEGIVRVSGRINASGRRTNSRGGRVIVTGQHVLVDQGAKINVNGDTEGGEILIGGNSRGATPLSFFSGQQILSNASDVTVNSGALLSADALSLGNGGKIVVWSDNNTRFYGNISAQGGVLGGNGGLAETSGHLLDITNSEVNLSASHGTTGTWLLDPFNVIINGSGSTVTGSGTSNLDPYTSGSTDSFLNATDLQNALGTSNIYVQTSSGGSIEVDSALNWNSSNTLNLTSSQYIYLNAAITALNGGLTLSAANGTQSLTAGTIGSGTVGNSPTTLTAAINVANFILSQGQWFQHATSLPTFSVSNNFQIASGSTYNAYNAQFTRINTTSGNGLTDVYGLQGVGTASLSTSYILNNNIDATLSKNWNNGAGFVPIAPTGLTDRHDFVN